MVSFAIHGGCSSVVESQIVDLVVAGSNPVIHPKSFYAAQMSNTQKSKNKREVAGFETFLRPEGAEGSVR